MNSALAHQHISPSGIAQLAGVSTSTVSNWRARHGDFPEATAGTEARPLFSLPAVLKWLKAKNKPIKQDPDRPDFALASSLRGIVPAEDMLRVLLPLMCWVKFSQEPDSHLEEWARFPFRGPHEGPMEALWHAGMTYRLGPNAPLSAGFALLEVRDVLDRFSSHPEQVLQHISALLWDVDPYTVGEQLVMADAERLRGGLAAYMTPPPLSGLLVRMIGDRPATIADLACGAGQTLLDAHAVHPQAELHGNDQRADIVELTVCRWFLADVPARLTVGDALENGSTFDAVIMHGPSGLLHGTQKVRASHLPFGGITGSRSDLAWALVAYQALNPGGRAAVVLPQRALSRTGGSSQVLPRMIAEGAVESIIALPTDIQRHTKAPSYVVVLHRPEEPVAPQDVLLVDLSRHTGAGLTDAVVDETVAALAAWRRGDPVQHPSAAAVPVPKLLSPEASLAPQAWIQAAQPVDNQRLLAQVEQTQSETDEAEQALRSLTVPPTALSPLHTAVETSPLGNTISHHRGTVQVHRSDSDPDAELVKVLTPQSVATGEPERLSVTLPDSPVTARAGQVAVAVHRGQIVARVWEAEGLPVSRGVVLLDVDPTVHDPEFVAHMLMAEVNQATLAGQTTPVVKVEKLLLPHLPLEDQRQAGSVYRQLRLATETAARFAAKAKALLEAAGNTVSTGQFTLR